MVLVIEIRDELVKRWGSIFINEPTYEGKRTAILLPGFELSEHQDGEKPAVRFIMLTQADMEKAINKRNAKPEEPVNTKLKSGLTGIATVAKTDVEKEDEIPDTEPEKPDKKP